MARLGPAERARGVQVSQDREENPAHLVIGLFDPVDASAVAEVARWARDRRVRVIVLGDSFCLTRPPLSPIAERVEIVGYVRGVSEVLAADDLPHLDKLIEAAGLEVGVTWLTDTPLLVRHGSDRGSVVPSPIRAMA